MRYADMARLTAGDGIAPAYIAAPAPPTGPFGIRAWTFPAMLP